MAARLFDRDRVRAVRRAAEIPQSAVGDSLGVAGSTVAGWESGPTAPDPEKLPGLAKALGREVDDLFPRRGLPDLTDLRCDAGIYQYETAAIIGTKSAGPVAGAERGERRLKEKYLPALAQAYGVRVEDLLRAQERSIAKTLDEDARPGEDAAAVSASAPQTLAEKIGLLLDRSFPGEQGPPSDAEIAAAVNGHAGADVITAAGIEALRTGAEETASPVVVDALAGFFGVSRVYFQSDDVVAREVYEGLRALSAARKGGVGRVRARGAGPDGLSPEVLALVADLFAEMEPREPGTQE